MATEFMSCLEEPGRLIELLSAPEGSQPWAAGMRHEIQACTSGGEFDREYASHCLSLLLRTGGWRRLRDAAGESFATFLAFCDAARPHGLGLTRTALGELLSD
jgi:hypothetical protein